ncbi:MAG: gamma-glutamylcyclotransferase [Cyanosarcina radialis HA8281-LM2]|nr:gamma-glutamylcyclotransferase [Cyanosarcina radialis HA8281-LM2]
MEILESFKSSNAGRAIVFVYGTLKPGEANYQIYCAGKVLAERRAIAFGRLFSLPAGYPAMTSGNCPVHGFLLSFADIAILDDLDRLEDYQRERPCHENEYDRQLIPTFSPDGRSLGLAWVYLMNLDRVSDRGGVLLADGWWEKSK